MNLLHDACVDPMRVWLIASLLGVTMQPPSNMGRYVVTAEPLDVGSSVQLCLAIDANDAHGVWWWQPGNAGCANRSTGPKVFDGEAATVFKRGATIEAAFRLPLRGFRDHPDHVDVRIVVEGDRIRSQVPNSGVRLAYRNDLAIPNQ